MLNLFQARVTFHLAGVAMVLLALIATPAAAAERGGTLVLMYDAKVGGSGCTIITGAVR